MSERPFILGLTGSIGMGKSTVAEMLRDLGVPVFDADAEVRRLQGPGGPLIAPIEAAFPGSTGPDGVLREKLGEHVFGDTEALARLEAIVHPVVREVREEFFEYHFGKPIVVFDIPLLYEKDAEDQVDAVAVVSAPADEQRARVMARHGMTAEKYEHILRLQVPDHQKRARADFVIDTGTTLEKTRDQVRNLIAGLRDRL